MAYLENNLGKDEKIILKAILSERAIFFGIIIGGIIEIIAALYLSSFDQRYIHYLSHNVLGRTDNRVTAANIILFVAMPIAIICRGIPIFSTVLGLTNQKIIGKSGVINTKILNSSLDEVNGIAVEQDLLGRIFGYSKIVIITSSGSYKFNYIKNADSFRAAVMEQIDIAKEEKLRKQAEQLAGAMK